MDGTPLPPTSIPGKLYAKAYQAGYESAMRDAARIAYRNGNLVLAQMLRDQEAVASALAELGGE